MSFSKNKFSQSLIDFLNIIIPRFKRLKLNQSDLNKLILEADASIPYRSIGMSLIVLSTSPFYLPLFLEPDNMSRWNGYDFFNHLEAIPFRLFFTLPGLWILIFYEKVSKCVFDKENNTFSLESGSYISNQKVEGNLEDISAIEVAQIEKPTWNLFGGSIFTHIQVHLMRNSGETVSFIYIEQKSEVESSIIKTRNMITEFLALPSDIS
ncbi:MAG: hypothetical protein AAFQ91_12790 [Cyanobacteria bacterium J06621_15]